METIDKLRAVIKSCETPEQLAVARRYMQRAIDLTDACLYVAELHRLMRAQRRLIEVETALSGP